VPIAYSSSPTDPHVLTESRYRIPPPSRVIPGLGAMALGIARTAIETLVEIAVEKTPERTTQALRENHIAQVRVSQAESLVRSARLFLLDSLEQLWSVLIAKGEVATEARAHVRLAGRTPYPARSRQSTSFTLRLARARSTRVVRWNARFATSMRSRSTLAFIRAGWRRRVGFCLDWSRIHRSSERRIIACCATDQIVT
jgi:hypothetical protein